MDVCIQFVDSVNFPFSFREGWQEELKVLVEKLNISVVFDAIGGDMTGTMMQVFVVVMMTNQR